jgi:hypothetical protein
MSIRLQACGSHVRLSGRYSSGMGDLGQGNQGFLVRGRFEIKIAQSRKSDMLAPTSKWPITRWPSAMYSHRPAHLRRTLLLALPLVLCASCIGLPSGADADEAHEVRDLLVQRHSFPVVGKPDASGEDGIAVYWTPLSFRSELDIYGILRATEQDQIISTLDSIRRERNMKPISVTFHATRDEGDIPDRVIRRVMIRDPKPYDMRISDFYFQ